jgi:phosphoglucosamine mutase
VLPTPGAAFCVKNSGKVAAGIVISASHNPYYDNGIKIFNKDGFKLTDDQEDQLEELILMDDQTGLFGNIERTGRISLSEKAADNYVSFLKTIPQKSFKGLKAVIDCSNGAVSNIAPKLFESLGIECEILFNSPDGININDNCGSEHTGVMAKRVVDIQADLGLAFDGDGDRLIAVDNTGKTLTGDQVIAICAAHALGKKALANNCVVTTIMSNMGLKVTFDKLGIEHVMAGVGDRKVMQEMIARGAVVGGEDSGHMIFLNHHTTGDGMLSAIKLLEVMNETSKSLSELSSVMPVFPQELINVDVKSKPDISSVDAIMSVINGVEEELSGKGRVLVRYSGTQPVCRVMVEGPDASVTSNCCERIAAVVKEELN